MSEKRSPGKQPFAAFRLPPGRHGLAREHVAENQRWRLLGAAAELLAEHGYLHLTSHKVANAAAVSPQTFYAHFADLDECLLAAFEAGARDLEGRTLAEALELVAREPALARLLSVEARATVPTIAEAFTQLVESLAAGLHCAGESTTGALHHGAIRTRALVKAALGMLSEPALTASPAPSELTDQLTTLVSIGCAPRAE